ncbi:hypothetical protein ILYODFUR_034207 [Ilyodon furcidens]|uniref:Uncharacterized protein n=1 Tax=Ilyodon furcidens TaxID=33524 RepID=A0ABV0V8I4_9TELE
MDTETEMRRKKISTKEREVLQKGKGEKSRKELRKERRMKRIQDNILLSSTPAQMFILTAFLPRSACKMYLVVNAAQYGTVVYLNLNTCGSECEPACVYKVSP